MTKSIDAILTEEARQIAIEYQTWAADQNLSYLELAQWQQFFERLGNDFGLTEEFRENGIL